MGNSVWICVTSYADRSLIATNCLQTRGLAMTLTIVLHSIGQLGGSSGRSWAHSGVGCQLRVWVTQLSAGFVWPWPGRRGTPALPSTFVTRGGWPGHALRVAAGEAERKWARAFRRACISFPNVLVSGTSRRRGLEPEGSARRTSPPTGGRRPAVESGRGAPPHALLPFTAALAAVCQALAVPY